MAPDLTPIAAFDFDGTLTSGDCVVPYLDRVVGRRRVARALVASFPAYLRGGRDASKAVLLARTLAGRRAVELERAATAFADEVIRRRLRPDTVGRLRWHQRQGHRVVVVSASLSPYLAPIGAFLAVDAVLCTEVEIGPDGVATGRIAGANCRGDEKVRRLEAWMKEAGITDVPAERWAYGDSSGDDALLAWATEPVRVARHRWVGAQPEQEAS